MALLSILSSCGVKGPPLTYPETIVDSYTRDYTGSDPTPEELARMNNKTVIPSSIDPKQSPATTQPTTPKP